MNNPVNWFEIYVQDMDRARSFYTSLFGDPLHRMEGTEHEMWAFPGDPDGAGAAGALIRIPGYAPDGNGVVVYFSCAECDLVAQRAAESGGRIDTPKKSIGRYGNIALVIDTEGNTIGLHSSQ